MLAGYPKNLGDLWAGTACDSASGDPVVQYDALAPDGLNDGGTGRWLITQIGPLSAPPYSLCLAVSQTSDPKGSYYLYQQSFGEDLPDYPKFGVWPTASNSAYLGTSNLFYLGGVFIGAELCAYDRSTVLSGGSLNAICYTVPTPSYLPSDLDGATPPADGTPGYFLDFPTIGSLRLYELSPDFTTPSSSVLTQAPDIGVPLFQEACGGGACIPQPGTTERLASLGDRLMYRLAYRVFGTHTAMVVNHSVKVGSNSVGVRWYELRPAAGAWGVYQYGTYAPNKARRWMGSMAMDGAGDIALGFSLSSGRKYPSIAVTGRTPVMTLGTLGAQTILKSGTGSQTGANRWGDYTAMRIDPDDDATFWYTNEYYVTSSPVSWSTFIGAFQE